MRGSSFDTVIVSDLHLGAELSRADAALRLLKSVEFRRLILLGDIFSDLNFRRLKKQHWHFLSYIRKLSNPKRKIEVVWVEGNHDLGLSQLMSHLVGIPVYQHYRWDYAGVSHLAIHGHQFDKFTGGNPLLCRLGEMLFLQMQRMDPRGKSLSRFIDRANSRWLRLSSKVEQGALAYAREHGVDRIFCGHTHAAAHAFQDGILYCNSGSWVDEPCTFIGIDQKGVGIYEFESGTDHRDTSEERTLAPAPAPGLHSPAGLPILA
jgi:UDP-2,3-diacylglucosamine pyrophosphatase LpxH